MRWNHASARSSGDLAECGSSGAGALFDVLDLVVRRQLLIWTSWRPWFSLIALVGISGFYLNGMLTALSGEIFEQVTAWRRYGVHYNTGVTSFHDDVIQMSCLAAAIFWWTAVNASLLRRLSGRAGWLTGLLFYVVAIDSSGVRNFLSGAVVYRGNLPWWSAIGWVLPLNSESLGLVVLLFAIPAICGALGKLPAMIRRQCSRRLRLPCSAEFTRTTCKLTATENSPLRPGRRSSRHTRCSVGRSSRDIGFSDWANEAAASASDVPAGRPDRLIDRE